jgi:hypothetical protein
MREISPKKMPKRASKRLLAKPPSDEEGWTIFWKLKSLDDQTVAIMGAAYLEAMLTKLLRASFIPLNPDDDRRMFDGGSNGILGPFSNKIRIAHAMGIINFSTYHDMIIINDIRNVFAHTQHEISFETPEIMADCSKLKLVTDLSEKTGSDMSFINTTKDLYFQTIFLIRSSLHARIHLREQERMGDKPST